MMGKACLLDGSWRRYALFSLLLVIIIFYEKGKGQEAKNNKFAGTEETHTLHIVNVTTSTPRITELFTIEMHALS